MSAEEKPVQDENQENTASSEETNSEEAAVNAEAKLKEQLLYMRAEFENSKRRLLREQETAIRFANEKMVGDLLTVVDLFDRALDSGANLKNHDDAKGLFTGIEMTQRELIHMLGRHGVELVGSSGEKFNPNIHEAVSQAPVENDKIDTVVAVAARGCLLQGRLIKPAKVVVGIAKE